MHGNSGLPDKRTPFSRRVFTRFRSGKHIVRLLFGILFLAGVAFAAGRSSFTFYIPFDELTGGLGGGSFSLSYRVEGGGMGLPGPIGESSSGSFENQAG